MDFMRQIREFRSNFENISRDCRAIVARLSYDSRETFVRLSHDVATHVALVSFSFVRQLRDIRESVSRHSYECRLVLFSRQIVARTVTRLTVERYSYDNRTSVAKFSHCKVRQNFAGTCLRHSHERPTTVARLSRDSLAICFAEKIHINF